MTQRCAVCGQPLPDGARFCMTCGARVEVPSAPPLDIEIPPSLRAKLEAVRSELRGDRRQVVILFADLEGFTSFAEGFDPEELTLLVGGVLRELAAAVHDYEGYIDKYIGDAVMALFGAPLAHEDDPERAVLAGLAMLERIERRRVQEQFPLSLRVGIHSGEVVAAHMGDELRLQYTVVGDAVNVASRLEGRADANTVLVSEAVYARIAPRFAAVPLPPLMVKGRKEPVKAFRILGAREGRRDVQSETQFVGRAGELARLDSLLARGTGAAVLLGDAGSGKSRLVHQAIDRARGSARVIELGFSAVRRPGERSAPAELFLSLARHVDEAIAIAGEEHEAGIEGLAREAGLRREAAEPDVNPAAARERRWLALASLVVSTARERPVILLVEDLHWAEEEAHDFLGFLLRSIEGEPVVAFLTSRDRDLEWLPADMQIRLSPLDDEAAGQLLGDLLQIVPPVQRRELLRRAAGNPLFLEELANALRQGVQAVPDTLQGLLRARIDRLDPAVRTALQMASVLGSRFPTTLLERMYGLEHQSFRFADALGTLEAGGFLVPLEGDRRFAHDLLQEVAYNGLLVRVRKVLHESAARLGEELFADRLDQEAPFFAHHYWQAELRAEALPHLWVAGRAAAERYDLPAAQRYLHRTSEALEEHPFAAIDERAAFCETFGKVLLWRGEFEQADLWFCSLEQEGEEANIPAWRARAFELRGRVAWHRGRLDEARGLFESGLEIAPSDAEALIADLHNALGVVHYYRSDPNEAFAHHEEALRLRERLHDRLGLAKSHSNIGNILRRFRHDLTAAEERYRQALALAQEVGDRQMVVAALHNLGEVALERGEWAKGLEQYRHVERLQEEIGWAHTEWVTCLEAARCEIGLGRIREAVGRLSACLRDGDPVLEPVNRVNVRLYLFEAWLSAREDDRARAALADARRLTDELELPVMRDDTLLREGRLAAAEGDWAAAARILAQAQQAARELKNRDSEPLITAHRLRAEARARSTTSDSAHELAWAPDLSTANDLLIAYLRADAAIARDSPEEAIEPLARVVDRAAELQWVALEASAANALSEAHGSLGHSDAAAAARARALQARQVLALHLHSEPRGADDVVSLLGEPLTPPG